MRKRLSIGSFVVIFLVSLVIIANQPPDIVDLINQQLEANPTSSGMPAFNLLDATQFTNPMYPWLGYPVTILSEKQLLGEGDNKSTPPDEFKIKQVLFKHQDKKRLILSMPSWKIDYDKNDDTTTKRYIEWYLQVIKWAKEALPNTNIGLLGIPYSPWDALKSTKVNMQNYQRVNEHLKPVMDASDTLYPSFQVFNDEKSDLSYLMGVQLYIAKISGKPVFPVISHKDTRTDSLFSESVSFDFIKQQCHFVRNNADGMVWRSSKNEKWTNGWYEAVADHCFL